MGNVISDAAAFEPRARAAVGTIDYARTARIPWYVWCLTAAITSQAIGGYWDISWHISIGRDTFWTPAHMMTYLAGVLAGIASGYAILATTFGSSDSAKDTSVSVWGFRGPLGCFMAAWGGIAMLTSAPFDNWWHAAYGLDVKIVSLPHSMLAFGEAMINFGTVILVCAHVNRAAGAYREKLNWLLLYSGGIVTFGSALFILESTPMEMMHSARFYESVARAFPIALIAISCVSSSRWPATTMAAIYMGLFIAGLWIFPLFAAAPKLGPVYQSITHMVPLWFPVLLIVPAIALDVLRRLMGKRWGRWQAGLVAGFVYIFAFVAAQWPFADFLISQAARNRIFGTIYFGYSDPANLLYNPYHFMAHEGPGEFAFGMALALLFSIVFCSIGMAIGNWLRTVQR
ncbi:MAG TPA: hypothetical protein VJX23_12580 [Candidatus Binataceae bacterium]|nr:hypothetical protein [Candidatus Binataceae bacterium]